MKIEKYTILKYLSKALWENVRTFLLRRRMNNPLILRHILKYTVNKFVFLFFNHGTCYKFSLFFYPPHPGLLLRIPAILDRILILTFFAWFSFVYQESSVVLCSFSLLEFSKKKLFSTLFFRWNNYHFYVFRFFMLILYGYKSRDTIS